MGKISINVIRDLVDLDYTGYLWLSNEKEPSFKPEEIKKQIQEKMLSDNESVFIVEGQLFHQDKSRTFSLSIKYVDGKYWIYKNDVDPTLLSLNNGEQKSVTIKNEKGEDIPCIVERKDYLSNRMDEQWIQFLRYWVAQPDENCMGMPVFVITKNVFVGFKK